jgi:hypothetical protein
VRDLLDELSQYQSAETLWSAEEALLLPVLPIDIRKDGVQVSFFTVISTFGTAQDATAGELRIESFFPANAATEQMFRALLPAG